MRSKSIVLLALALGCGLVASIGISQVMERRNTAEAPTAETEPVFVAGVDINYNDELTPERLKLEEWPKDKIHADALRTLEQTKGKRAAHKIFAGEQIRADKLMGADGFVTSSRKIPAGYRVVSVRVDAVTGASGLILPNDRVDVLVYLARNPGTGIEETSTKTILQDVRVFAVDTQFERKHGQDEPSIAAKTISLLVTPSQAEKVTLATEMGTIRLVMRSPDDSTEGTASGARIKDIFGQADKLAREEEERSTDEPSADALAWLKQQKSQPDQAAPPATQPTASVRQSWKVTLLEGPEVRQLEINGDDQFPELTTEPSDSRDGDAATSNQTDSRPDGMELPSGNEESAPAGDGSQN